MVDPIMPRRRVISQKYWDAYHRMQNEGFSVESVVAWQSTPMHEDLSEADYEKWLAKHKG